MTGKMRHAGGILLAAAMTLSVTFSGGSIVYADGDTITISGVEDLERLAKQ